MTPTTQPQTEGDGSQEPLPSYSEAVDQINKSIAAVRIQPTPSPPGTSAMYWDAPQTPYIKFEFNPYFPVWEPNQPWFFGEMHVKCKDVPLLMRKGFHWTTANVMKEEGYLNNIAPEIAHIYKPRRTCKFTRFWFLRDLQQPPQWTACLKVHTENFRVASGIRLENWTIDLVRTCQAVEGPGKKIYYFDALKAENNLNAIYDDMPLEGWWPWPKAPGLVGKLHSHQESELN